MTVACRGVKDRLCASGNDQKRRGNKVGSCQHRNVSEAWNLKLNNIQNLLQLAACDSIGLKKIAVSLQKQSMLSCVASSTHGSRLDHSLDALNTTRRAILIMGIGRFLRNRPEFDSAEAEAVKQKVSADMEEVRSAGFDCVSFDMNPEDPSETLQRLRDQLRSQPWDGVLIGFGVRGAVELTPLFEAAVNLCVKETAHSTKLMFSAGPDKIFEAIRRNFPEES